MVDTSDIPDWVFNETGSSYDPAAYAQPDTQAQMFRSSPAAHVQNVKAPIYFMIGSQDLRVPPHQGIQMYRALKAAGKEVRLNVFEDCHPLSKVPVHTNVMVNLATFFHEFTAWYVNLFWNGEFVSNFYFIWRNTRAELFYEYSIFDHNR